MDALNIRGPVCKTAPENKAGNAGRAYNPSDHVLRLDGLLHQTIIIPPRGSHQRDLLQPIWRVRRWAKIKITFKSRHIPSSIAPSRTHTPLENNYTRYRSTKCWQRTKKRTLRDKTFTFSTVVSNEKSTRAKRQQLARDQVSTANETTTTLLMQLLLFPSFHSNKGTMLNQRQGLLAQPHWSEASIAANCALGSLPTSIWLPCLESG